MKRCCSDIQLISQNPASDQCICHPLQDVLDSFNTDREVRMWMMKQPPSPCPRLRLMLIVIGVVHQQTPNMLALALLWETSQKDQR